MGEQKISTKLDCDNANDLATCNTDNPPIQDIDIARTIVHEDYDDYLKRYDIALIQLKSEVVFRGIMNVQTICLPVKPSQMIENIQQEERMTLQMTTSGWGYTETNQKASDVMMHSIVPYLNQTECSIRIKELRSRISSINFDFTDTHLVNF